MRTIHSRTYTNVALTVLIVLLLALVVRPYLSMPKAYAESYDSDQPAKSALHEPLGNAAIVEGIKSLANSNKDIAAANLQIAAATREAAKAQEGIAKAIGRLSEAK